MRSYLLKLVISFLCLYLANAYATDKQEDKDSWDKLMDWFDNTINEEKSEKNFDNGLSPNYMKAPPEWKNNVHLRILNKITANSDIIDMQVGQTIEYKNFELKAYACDVSLHNEHHESRALLVVNEIKKDEKKQIFSGWLFAESPSTLPFIHVKYDIILLKCD